MSTPGRRVGGADPAAPTHLATPLATPLATHLATHLALPAVSAALRGPRAQRLRIPAAALSGACCP